MISSTTALGENGRRYVRLSVRRGVGMERSGIERVCGLSAAFGSLAADAALVAGCLERPSDGAESFAAHIAQGKGFLLYGLLRRLLYESMRG